MLPGMVDAMPPSSLSGAGLKKAMAGVSNLKEGGGSNVTVALVSKPTTAAPNSGFAKHPEPRGHSGETNIFLHHVADEYGSTIGTVAYITIVNGACTPANLKDCCHIKDSPSATSVQYGAISKGYGHGYNLVTTGKRTAFREQLQTQFCHNRTVLLKKLNDCTPTCECIDTVLDEIHAGDKDVVGESYVQQGPPTPSVCAARALNATDPSRVTLSLWRGHLREACGLRQAERGPDVRLQTTIAGVEKKKNPIRCSMQTVDGAFGEARQVSQPAPVSLDPGSKSRLLPSNSKGMRPDLCQHPHTRHGC